MIPQTVSSASNEIYDAKVKQGEDTGIRLKVSVYVPVEGDGLFKLRVLLSQWSAYVD